MYCVCQCLSYYRREGEEKKQNVARLVISVGIVEEETQMKWGTVRSEAHPHMHTHAQAARYEVKSG